MNVRLLSAPANPKAVSPLPTPSRHKVSLNGRLLVGVRIDVLAGYMGAEQTSDGGC